MSMGERQSSRMKLLRVISTLTHYETAQKSPDSLEIVTVQNTSNLCTGS